jgi:hypothetical protein
MSLPNALWGLPGAELLDTVWPDFLLACTFFTALSYAVLGPRFGRERPAAAMSVALGAALAIGFVAWEYANDWSIRELGPVALGLALIILAATTYQAIHRVGGSWAGIGVALGTSVLLALVLGVPLPIRGSVLLAIGLIGLLAGLGFLGARTALEPPARRSPAAETITVRRELADVAQDRGLAEMLARQLRDLRIESQWVGHRPELAEDVRRQLGRLLPAEGALTERLARLRARGHALRVGHVAQLDELKQVAEQLSPAARQRLAAALVARYQELQLDTRLERLDRAVAEVERRVRALTVAAERRLEQQDWRSVPRLLADAERLQAHNAQLLKLVERTETRLLGALQQLASQACEVSPA